MTNTLNWETLAEAIAGALAADATLFSIPVYDSERSDDYTGIIIVCLDYFHTSADTFYKVQYKQ